MYIYIYQKNSSSSQFIHLLEKKKSLERYLRRITDGRSDSLDDILNNDYNNHIGTVGMYQVHVHILEFSGSYIYLAQTRPDQTNKKLSYMSL